MTYAKSDNESQPHVASKKSALKKDSFPGPSAGRQQTQDDVMTNNEGAQPTSVLSTPAHRSHDSRNNLKRSDPFQFGSRYLLENDDVFEFNAWDHVEPDEAYMEYASSQFAKQKEAPVSAFDKFRFNNDPAKWWNQFYKNNTSNFFKNRKWLQQEFPILSMITQPESPPTTVLEVGAGAGNTAFPILAQNQNPKLKIHACDFSKRAIELIKASEQYDESYIQADVWDVASEELPNGLAEGSVDVALMLFIFSALSPSQWQQAIRNIYRVLKPGGEVLFRDYGRGDLAQVRFRKGRYMEENFYVRGDGTRVYFFEKEELTKMWHEPEQLANDQGNKSPRDAEEYPDQRNDERPEQCYGFDIIDLGVDRRLIVNRQTKQKMYRCWLQGRFQKRQRQETDTEISPPK